MTEQVSATSAAPRCLGRLTARELTAEEIEAVGGGASYTGVTDFHWTEDGYEFQYADNG